jgi:hypothetical protein
LPMGAYIGLANSKGSTLSFLWKVHINSYQKSSLLEIGLIGELILIWTDVYSRSFICAGRQLSYLSIGNDLISDADN